MTSALLSMEIGAKKNYLQWDDYFMATALLAAKRSKDPVTQVGACLVDDDNRIVSIGYNGMPRGCSDEVFPWTKGEDRDPLQRKKMFVVHAEANAILNRNSTHVKGTRLYTTLFPCNECAKLIIQSGIKTIYYVSDKHAHKPSYQASKLMFDATGIEYNQYKPVQKRIVLDFEEIIY